jgi:hypothetical protein
MSEPSTPDPKTVREIAREAIRSASQRLELIDSVIARHRAIGDRPASGSGELMVWHATYSSLCRAVRVEMRAASWPDEQPPADPMAVEVKCGRECSEMHTFEQGSCEAAVTAEQQQDGAVERVEAWLDNRIHSTFYGPVAPETICSYPVDGDDCSIVYVLTEPDLRAVLAERTALAARVAELGSERTSLAVLLLAEHDEREADTRAVMAVLKLGEVLYLGQRPTDWTDARRGLLARFADRIAALAAAETEES